MVHVLLPSLSLFFNLILSQVQINPSTLYIQLMKNLQVLGLTEWKSIQFNLRISMFSQYFFTSAGFIFIYLFLVGEEQKTWK